MTAVLIISGKNRAEIETMLKDVSENFLTADFSNLERPSAWCGRDPDWEWDIVDEHDYSELGIDEIKSSIVRKAEHLTEFDGSSLNAQERFVETTAILLSLRTELFRRLRASET